MENARHKNKSDRGGKTWIYGWGDVSYGVASNSLAKSLGKDKKEEKDDKLEEIFFRFYNEEAQDIYINLRKA